MKLTPLMEHDAVRKLLMVVPLVFHDETVKTLRMIQFSSWLAGYDCGQSKDIPASTIVEIVEEEDFEPPIVCICYGNATTPDPNCKAREHGLRG